MMYAFTSKSRYDGQSFDVGFVPEAGHGKAVARLRNDGLRQPGFAARRQSSLYPMPMA
jgi:hypothetical protein